MTVPGGSVAGNAFSQSIKQLQTLTTIRPYQAPVRRAVLLAVYDPETIEEDPPPQWVIDRMKLEGYRRLWAKVIIMDYERYGERFVPIDQSFGDVLGCGNAQSLLALSENEIDPLVELPAKNISSARIVGWTHKSPRDVMVGREEQPAEATGPISPMQTSRVFSILGV